MRGLLLRIMILAVAGALVAIPVVQAHWNTNGTAVCDTTGAQVEHQVTTDGFGGAIVAWVDNRSAPDLYAQKIDSLGARAWNRQGVPVCTAAFGQHSPKIIPDGAGGAILTWEDGRPDPNLDIYTQRIDLNGNSLWTLDGVALCQAGDDQEDPQLTTDGGKGAIIVWQDKRNDPTLADDIYVQRVDSLGIVQWTTDGVPLCTTAGTQEKPQIAPDGAGGAIMAWLDYRAGSGFFHIYAQRVDADGVPLWTANGVAVCTAGGPRYDPHIISDNNGGAIIVWQDRRSFYDVYAQRIDADGNSLWTADGVPVCLAPGYQAFPNLVPDGSGGAVISWQDLRDGNWDIYARRINSQGDTLWTPNGVPICTLVNSQYNPRLTSDGQGGAVIAWEENRTGNDPDIYTQRIDASGSVLWTAGGIPVCAATAGQNFPRITTDGSHGAIVIWGDQRNDATHDTDVYIGSVDEFGDIKVPTLVRTYQAEFDGAQVIIRWTLAESGPGTEFFISRSESPLSDFYDLPAARIEYDGIAYTFTDRNCLPGRVYRYRVDVMDEGGRKNLFQTSPVAVPAGGVLLEQNFPNPFNPGTTIRFSVPSSSHIKLTVFDPDGRRVKTLVNEVYPAGQHKTEWDGTDSRGNPTSTGVYLYRLQAGKTVLTRKMTLVK